MINRAATSGDCPGGLQSSPDDQTIQDPTAFVRETNGRRALDLQVSGARCGACLAKIEGGVGALPGVELARLNLSNGRLRVEWRGPLAPKRILETLVGHGYAAAPHDPDVAEDARKQEERSLLIKLAVAAFAAGNVMLLSESVWYGGDAPPETRQLLHWLSAPVSVIAVAFSGQPFFHSALASIRARKLNMDVPISLAVLLALGMSLWQAATGGEHAYFDAAATLLFFLLIGRFLDARLRRRAWASANALAAMQASTATRIAASGSTETVRAADIRQGDTLLIAAGDRLCVDAQIVSGDSDIDLRLITGEVEPVAARAGMMLHAGAVNLSGVLHVRAISAAGDSLMADIARMLEAGEQKKSAWRTLADRAAEIYVPWVHALAALGFVGWIIAGGGFETAAFVAVSVLIITCPCALALAAPAVQVVAAGRLYREGAFLTSGDALERLAGIDHVVFDKTGTLTLGDPVLVPGIWTTRDLADAARLARASRHPFSRALSRAAGVGPVADDVREHPGQGVSGMIDGEAVRLGSPAFMGADVIPGSSAIWFRRGDCAPVAFNFADVVRPQAREAIGRLEALGVTAEILSGDAPTRVRDIAERLDIEVWTASASPHSKAARLSMLQQAGKRVLMVGDGLNDAGALAGAHASIAPGGAVDVSRLVADCVFSGDSLVSIVRIVEIARAARSRMRENFGFSALYNVIAVPVALAGLATPLVAALAMSMSSLVVMLNALRLVGSAGSRERAT